VPWSFAAHVSPRQTTQFVVNERDEPIEGVGLATAPGEEKRSGAGRLLRNALILRPFIVGAAR
jgi:hypothetical protein